MYAQRNQALLFHVFLETGAVYYRLPLDAFVNSNSHNIETDVTTSDVQLWDCLSNQIEVIQWSFLKDQTGLVNLGRLGNQKGRYLFTIEFLQNDTSELDLGFINVPGEYKCAHVLSLDNGYFCAMPNNRIVWQDQAFVKNNNLKHDYKINRNRFFAEADKAIENENDYFYNATDDIEHLADAVNYIKGPNSSSA